MVKVKKNSLFVRFLLIALVALSAPLQAVFSFKDLYNSVASKVAFKKGKEKVAEIVVASKKPVNEEFKKIQKKIGILLMVFGLAGLAGCYLIDKIAHPFDPLNPPHNPQHNPFRPIHPDLAPEPRPHPINDLPRVEPRQVIHVDFMGDDVSAGAIGVEDKVAVEGQTKECPICYEDKNPECFYKMSCCGMEFCKKCLLGNNGPISITIKNKSINELKCPNRNCNMKNSGEGQNGTRILNTDLVALLGKNSEHLRAIEVIRDKNDFSLLGLEGGFRNCPTVNCPSYYLIPQDNNGINMQGNVRCTKCNKEYCVDCQLVHSGAVSCQQAKEEDDRIKNMTKDEAKRLNEQWVRDNTKKCPHCNNDTLKNGGCKHMTCKCRWEYCWDCLQGGMGHGGYPHRNFYECPAHPELAHGYH